MPHENTALVKKMLYSREKGVIDQCNDEKVLIWTLTEPPKAPLQPE